MSGTMRNARVFRVSATRDVCLFCATRQLAVPGTIQSSTSPAISQRRHLNSSTKASNYAEDQLYAERPRPLSLAERQQRTRQVAQPFQPSQSSQPTQVSLAERQRGAPGPRITPIPRPQQPRSTDNFGADRSRREDTNEGRTPIRRTWYNKDVVPPRSASTYRVNTESRKPAIFLPQFGSVQHLRRRNDPTPEATVSTSEEPKQQPATPVREPIRKLDAAELDRLLKMNSRRPAVETRPPPRPTPTNSSSDGLERLMSLSSRQDRVSDRESRLQYGSALSRQRRNPFEQQQESVADAAEQWVRKRTPTESENMSVQQEQGFEERRTYTDPEKERRRRRFAIDDDADVARNTYDDATPRGRTKDDRRQRRPTRSMRNQDEDELDEIAAKAERKRQRKEAKRRAQLEKEEPTPIYLPEYISVANLASLLKMRAEEFCRKLEQLGFEDVQNDHILDAEHAGLIAREYNYEPILQEEGADEDLYPAPAPSAEEYAQLPQRPPVVTIMGHVDHGKTTILDYIRSTSVAATEFGGITQHIGAFSVPLTSGKKITFLDTPGHSAFETMRKRGANVTDIVVLVVAADDSVKPQTIEAIKHAQAAGVPMIVAINKIDKEQANPDKVRQDLARNGVEVEEYGGDTQTVCVSGKTGQGIADLEEAISLLSEILDQRANPKATVEGWILEGSTKKSGKTATVLVRNGTLRVGDVIVAGSTWARVRTLKNEAGVIVEEVTPGMPAEVDGWREQPTAGDEVLQAEDEQRASAVTELRQEKREKEQMAKDIEAINESRKLETERRKAEEEAAKAEADAETEVSPEKASGPEIVPFIVKADVSGSVEAVVDSIASVGNHEVASRVLRSGVGSPSEFDVQHAADARGHIVNFNTGIPPNIAAMAEQKGVKILDSNIIYRVVENVKALLSEKLPPRITSRVVGEAEVAAVFEIGLGGKRKLKVAGSKVRNGIVDKRLRVKVTRGERIVFDGAMSSLKNQKKDAERMGKDTECGIAFEGWEQFEVGDKVQCYEEIREKRSL
ncbi:initiation factor 2 [Delitschia confertaspora ATCC 74209]|uniref:Translation initiation factor IF-2, mitochondrial n=1 Tax=Delitschia confertaspora ATCC 74209 TaxID=1513339 RepID=A0A9P4MZ55_9PLEO|nr:initiation factor 2 [Delitschia confertaspora ATCC 74209]